MSLIAKYAFNSSDYNGGSGTTIFDQSGNNYTLSKVIVNSEGGSAGWKDNSTEQNPYNDSNIYSYRFQRPGSNNDRGGHFETTTNISPNPYTGDFSLSFWCKPQDSTMPKHESFVSFHDSNTLDTFQIGMANGGNIISVTTKSSNNEFFPIGSYSGYITSTGNNKWTFVAVTFNNSTSTLNTYIREQDALSFTEQTYNTSTTPSTSGHNFDIYDIKAGSNRNETHKYNGLLTLFRVYDEELNSTAIETLFSLNEHCYHQSTNILTDYGYINITKLMRGDLIKTIDGYKPLAKLIKSINVKNKFIKFTKNSIGKDIPNQDLMITSGHPVYFNDEYYLPENFLELKGVDEVCENSNNVYHLVFDTHEVIYSNGLTTTSLPPNTTCDNMALKENEYYDKKNYKEENLGKMYPPYILHENPIFMKKIYFL